MLEHAALLAFSFLGTLLILIPLVFHIQNRNVAVICLCLWLALYNGITFLNGIIWNGQLGRHAAIGRGYCDVASRIQLVTQPALMGCAIAILRYLSMILSSSGVSASSRSNRLRRNMIDLSIIFGVPIFILFLQLILTREVRYYIVSFRGCTLSGLESSPYLLALYIWSPLMGVLAVFYAATVLYALNKKRRAFRDIIRNAQSGLDVSRFTRLLMLAILAILVVAPIDFYQFYAQTQQLSRKAHYTPRGHHANILFFYPGVAEVDLWPQWFSALISIIFAALFGVGREAFGTYERWANKVPGASKLLEFSRSTSSRLSSRFSSQTSIQHKSGGSGGVCAMGSSVSSEDSFLAEEKGEFGRDIVGQGHNHSELGVTSCRVWKEVPEEHPFFPLHSPNKIKIQQDLTQEMECREGGA